MAKTSEEDFESVTHHNTIFRVELCALGGDVGEAATAVKCTMVAQEYQGYLTHHSSRNCVSKGLLEDNDGLIILNSGDELEGGQGSWGSFSRDPCCFRGGGEGRLQGPLGSRIARYPAMTSSGV